MAELYLYNALGTQLEPKTDGTVEAEGIIASLSDSPVELWIDTGRNRAFAQLRANWSGTSRDVDQFRAVYEGGPNESVIKGFGLALDEVEDGNRWQEQSAWNFIKDEGFDLPWVIQTVGNKTLQNLGLDLREELAIVRLLEDGETLQLGMESTESAVIAASYIYRAVEGSTTIAISSDGYKSSIKSTDLLLKPGSEVGDFYALTDDTKSKLFSRVDSLVDNVESEYKSQVNESIERLVGNVKFSGWETHQELSRIKAVIQQQDLTSQNTAEPTSQAGQELCELQAKVKNGDELREGYNVEILDQEKRQELINWTVEELKRKQTEIESNALERTRSELLGIIDRVTELNDDTAARSLGLMLERTKGTDLSNIRTHQLVDEFSRQYADLQESKLLSHSEVLEIEDTIRTELQDGKAEYVQNERDRLGSLFESAIDEFFRGSGRAGQLLGQARSALEDVETDGEEIPSVTAEFDRALSEFQENTILGDDDKMVVKDEVLEIIDSRESDLRESEKESQRERLKNQLHSLRRDTTNDNEFRRLCLAMLVVDRREDQPDDVSSIASFTRRLDKIEDHPALTGSDVRQIKREVKTDIEAMLDDLRDSKLSSVIADVERRLSRVPKTDRDLESTIESLNSLRKHCDYDVSSTHSFEDRWWVQQTKDQIDSIRSAEYEGIPYFPLEKQNEALDKLGDLLDSRIESLSEKKLSEVKTRFSEGVDSLIANSTLSSSQRLQIINDCQSAVARGSRSSTRSRGFNNNLVVEEYPEIIQSPIATISECLEVTSEGESPVWLNDNRERALIEYFEDELDKAAATLEDQITETLIKQFREVIRSEHLASDVNGWTTELDDTRAKLDDIEKQLTDAKRTPNKLRYLSGIDEEHIEHFEGLSPTGREAVIEDVTAWIDEKRTEIRDNLADRAASAVRGALDSQGDTVASPSKELTQYGAALVLLQGKEPGEDVKGLDGDTLRTAREFLTEEQQNVLMSEFEESRAAAFHRYHETVVESVSDLLGKYADSDTNTTVGLDLLYEYCGGTDYEIQNSYLKKAKDEIDCVREKKHDGVISSEEAKDILQDIQTRIEDARAAAEPSTRIGKIKSKVGRFRGGNDISQTSPRSGIRLAGLLIGLAVLVVLLSGVVVTTGLGGEISSQITGGQSNSFTVSELAVTTDNNTLIVNGVVSSSTTNLDISIVGPGLNTTKTVSPQNGEFSTRLQRGDAGVYEVKLRFISKEPWRVFRFEVA